MNLWGVAPFVAAALIGGTSAHMATAGHAIARNASRSHSGHSASQQLAADSPASARPGHRGRTVGASPAPAPLGLPPATPGPVLRQVRHGWSTTVLLTENEPACQESVVYWLETTPPNSAIASPGTPVQTGTTGPAGTPATGSSCQVTVTFAGLRGVPATAALVVDHNGTLSEIPLTVSRDLNLRWYLGIPAIAGVGMALAVLLLSMIFVRVYDRDGRKVRAGNPKSWSRPILASGAWTLNDSWATNITAILALIGTFLATTTASSSLFPGVALDRFALLTIIAGGVVLATPLLFGILYGVFTGANAGPTADATLRLPAGDGDPRATIAVPSGATIVVPGIAAVTWPDGQNGQQLQGRLQAGKAISVPPGSGISFLPGAAIALPGTTSDIAVHAGSTLSIDGPGELIIPDSDMVQPAAPPGPPGRFGLRWRQPAQARPHAPITCPAHITTPGGARITVAGTADVTLPRGTVITAPWRAESTLRAPRELQVPQGSGVLVASLWMVVIAAVVTMFGIGAEIGIAGTLAFGLSEASGDWRWTMLAAIGAVAVLMLVYAVTATRAIADPQPGSSISSAPGSSFTL